MTHPLTPREKVARAIQAHDNDHVPDGYANGLSDEVSDWSAYLADRVLTALASGSGDHAELARLARKAREQMTCEATTDALWDGVDALLAEIAVLRSSNTEAERKLAEAAGLLRRIDRIYADMQDGNGNHPTELRKVRAFLNKEAERG